MSNYYYNPELYHYGVKGMKWGHRKAQKLEKRTERKYKRAGLAAGEADYWKKAGAAKAKKYNDMATAFEKSAKKMDKRGNHIKAEMTRRAAEGIRKKGEADVSEYNETAKRYAKKAERLTEKASTYATKKRVDLGKQRVDSVLAKAKKTGYDRAKNWDEYQQAERQREMIDTITGRNRDQDDNNW